MLKTDIVRLVKTLSPGEKRYFKLANKKQAVERSFIALFDLIEKTPFSEIEQLELEFKDLHPEASFENTAKYLLRMLTDALVSLKSDRDSTFQQLQGFMRARVLLDRSLTNEGIKEFRKIQKMATASQNYLIEYMVQREEMNILSGRNFPDTDDAVLIQSQMKSKLLLKNLLQIHEHHSLYEILKFRLIYSGKTITEDAKNNLNDLLLSELSLMTNKVAYNFESSRLHLSFQSLFFTSIGDYRSALKTFSELNGLYELNLDRLGSPPVDYLLSLQGILDSLRTIRLFEEMSFYIVKINSLADERHNEQFNYQVYKTAATFTLSLLIGQGKIKQANVYLTDRYHLLLKENVINDYEQHCELLFYAGVNYFMLNQWEKALKHIHKISFWGKTNQRFIIYKAARLLGIMTRYEMGDTEYLSYEIRAYKRVLSQKNEGLKIEKLVFKVIAANPNESSVVQNKLSLKRMEPLIKTITNDKFELQLLKYFDLVSWIYTKFNSKGSKIKHLKSRIQ